MIKTSKNSCLFDKIFVSLKCENEIQIKNGKRNYNIFQAKTKLQIPLVEVG